MNVVIFTHAAGSPDHGPNLRWYYLGRRLTELGCNVTIVGSSFFHKYVVQPKIEGLWSLRNIDEINYVFVRNIAYRGVVGRLMNQIIFPLMALVWSWKRGSRIKPDIVVASSPPPFCVFPAKYFAERNDASLVYEVRDLWPMVVQQLSGASDWHPYIRVLRRTERYAIRNSDSVVSVKPGDFDYFKTEYGLLSEQFNYFANGFLPNNLIENYSSESKANDDRKIVVGYVGAMSAYYGLNELLDTASQLLYNKDIKFVLVGAGEDFDALQKKKADLGLESVEFVGKVPKKDVSKYLASFDICYVGLKDVRANQHGVSCNKIFEYMHAGKPIVASYRTMFDPVQDGKCGITVSPGSPEEILQAILELSNSAEKREEMGRNGKKYFDENHDFSVIGEKYFEKFKQLRGRV